MKAVILAAGYGSRFSEHNVRHKALLQVNGQRVIDYTLDAVRQAGISDVTLVIGHEGGLLQEALGNGDCHGVGITYVENPQYHRGNAVSVLAAREAVGDSPFILSMADHMPSPEIVCGLAERKCGGESGNALAVDFNPAPRHVEEGTRVSVDEAGRIVSIGKQLQTWNGIDCGVFRFTPDIFDAVAATLAEDESRDELSQAVTGMIRSGRPLHAHDVSGGFWFDVDTWDDLEAVREIIGHGAEYQAGNLE